MSVSIVIPCFNAVRWLERAVSSCLAQGGVVGEILVVDNGSTDGSLALAETLAAAHPKVRVLHSPISHACVARNLGWQTATADWIQFLDADDELRAGKIQTQLAESGLAQAEGVLISPVIEEIWRGNEIIRVDDGGMNVPDDWYSAWLRWEVCQTGAALWSRSALQRIGGWNEEQPCCQDNEITMRALLAGIPFRFCPSSGAVYRHWTENTLSRKNPSAARNERTRLMDVLLEELTRRGELTAGRKNEADRMFLGLARSEARHDLESGVRYYHERRRRGLRVLPGPAAPLKYRLLLRFLGFRRTEKLLSLR